MTTPTRNAQYSSGPQTSKPAVSGADLRQGYNVQRRNIEGHKPWVVIFVYADGRTKVKASFETKSSAQRYVRGQR